MGFKKKEHSPRPEVKRVVPIDRLNETFLLGHALNDRNRCEELVSINHDNFLFVNHKIIHKCLSYIIENKLEIDVDAIHTLKDRFGGSVSVKLEYLGELQSAFKDEVTEENYAFHISKLKNDAMKDSIYIKHLPYFQELLTDPKCGAEEIMKVMTDINGVVDGSHLDSEFKFTNAVETIRDYNEELKIRGEDGDFRTTGYKKLDEVLTDGFSKCRMTIIAGRTSQGKCHGALTKILMHDGSIKCAKDIRTGDKLMGPDSKPRNVLSTTFGTGPMYRIKPYRGDSWECNDAHILSLKMNHDNGNVFTKDQMINISVIDYLNETKKFKHCAKLWRTGVEFEESTVEHPPYLIGLWLGDGATNAPSITNSDDEIISYLKNLEDYTVRVTPDRNTFTLYISKKDTSDRRHNRLLDYVRDCAYINKEKRIPKEYLINSRNIRLELLAGLIDTDGFKICESNYEIVTKYEGLCEDILYLCRSLSLSATKRLKRSTIKSIGFVGYYWKIIIGGDLHNIPVKVERRKVKKYTKRVNPLYSGFKVESLGVDKYYGFELDCDHLYLLNDFTVTHNTLLLCNIFLRQARSGIPVALYNFEMDSHSMIDRFISMITNIPLINIVKTRAKLTEEDLEKERKAKAEIESLPIFFYQVSTQTPEGIKRDLKILKDKYKVQVVAYDLFDKIKFPFVKNRSTADNINFTLKEIQGFGRDIGLHQILVVQVGRSAEQRRNKRPKLSELKDAGGYEERADNVLFVYRDQYYNDAEEKEEIGVEHSEDMEIIIAKQRQGAINVKVLLNFFPATMRVCDIDGELQEYKDKIKDDSNEQLQED